MKFYSRILYVLAAFATIACTREMPQTAVPSVSTGETVGTQPEASPEVQEAGFVPGVAIVYLDEATPESALLETESLEITGMRRLFPDAGEFEPRTRAAGLHRWYVVNFNQEISVLKAMSVLEGVSGVKNVEPSRKIINKAVNVNDPYWSRMWGVNNTAYPGYDVNCQEVWDKYTWGNPAVTVAVVDGGIQLDHPDLQWNVASTGHYNYLHNNTTITQHSHGTHVAGTIAAVNNNGIGVNGIAGGNALTGKGGVKLLSLQVFETRDGRDYSANDFAAALKEAADRGAVISQNSWGYNYDFDDNGRVEGNELEYAKRAHNNPDRSFTQAVDYFNKYAGCDNNGNQLPGSPMKGGVTIFAAGNDNIPYGPPANYDGCIAVGALSQNGTRAYFSNYGDWVDICAPGVQIYSTYINGGYINYSGTSMACPHVSGVAALIVSQFGGKNFTAEELRVRLLEGAKPIAASTGNYPIGPLVDATGSFHVNEQSEAPNAISDYTVTPVGHSLKFDFKATNGYAYMVLASKSRNDLIAVNLENPGKSIVTNSRIASSQDVEGAPISIQLMGLEPETSYYTAVVAYSYNREFSDLSSIKQIKTNANSKPVIDMPDYKARLVFRHYQTVDLPVMFSDPDGDDITVSFSTKGRASLETEKGSVYTQHFRLMCPLVYSYEPVQATIIVTDEVGATSAISFTYTVMENVAPAFVKDIPLVNLTAKGQTVQINLAEYISDEDGETLDYRINSTDNSVASVAIDEGVATITATGKGICKVSVSGTDGDGASAAATFTVLVRPEEEGEVTISGSTITKGGSITVIPGVEPSRTYIRVISSSGVVVYQTSGVYSAEAPIELDLSALAPGIYTLEVTYKDKVYTNTIVKR